MKQTHTHTQPIRLGRDTPIPFLSLSYTVCEKRGNIASAAFSGLLIAHPVCEPHDKKSYIPPCASPSIFAELKISSSKLKHRICPLCSPAKWSSEILSEDYTRQRWHLSRPHGSQVSQDLQPTKRRKRHPLRSSHSASLWSNKVYNNTQVNIIITWSLRREPCQLGCSQKLGEIMKTEVDIRHLFPGSFHSKMFFKSTLSMYL